MKQTTTLIEKNISDTGYISVIDDTGRASTLDLVNPYMIKVIGILPHQSVIQPRTVDDADKLIEWLTAWSTEAKTRNEG